MKILLLSDSHSYIGTEVLQRAELVDEVWHAGDIGDVSVLESLQQCAPVRAVYGNIDNTAVRSQCPENLVFMVQNLTILIRHIGGYPRKYTPECRQLIGKYSPDIIVCGHSHILKVMQDAQHKALFINPGAIGKFGFHAVRTMIEFEINNSVPQNMKVIEYEKKM
ncbi:MAG: metallophosphoesterase family protein [Bacteroidales bacterium]|jgi:putative phosphoesterase|nr:metallophosphoesterase family protein [Bacteroidales bacterium]